MKMTKLLGVAVVAATLTNAQAAIVTYTDRAAFDAAIATATSTIEDDFNNNISAADSITFSSGVVSENSPGRTVTDNGVAGGVYSNGVSFDGSLGSSQVDWTFPGSAFAVGFDYSTNQGANGVRVGMDDGSGLIFPALAFLGSSQVLDGFAGFISTDTFLSFSFIDASSGRADFSLDNLVVALAPAAPIPLPAAAPLFLMALAVAGYASRGKK